jgi:hypothetical protein
LFSGCASVSVKAELPLSDLCLPAKPDSDAALVKDCSLVALSVSPDKLEVEFVVKRKD